MGIFLENYRFYTTRVKTYSGETQRFHVALTIDYGSLKIVSTPPGAIVTLNGKAAGETPLTQEQLKPDSIILVALSLPGYQTWMQEVKIGAGKQGLVSAILEKENQHHDEGR